MLPTTLHLIETVVTMKFEDLASRVQPIQGLLPEEWNQHVNPDGSSGGWVQMTATAEADVEIGPDALVTDYAQVTNGARVLGRAHVGGAACVSGPDVVIKENAEVTDDARIEGKCILKGDVVVRGRAILRSGTHLTGVITSTDWNRGTRRGAHER